MRQRVIFVLKKIFKIVLRLTGLILVIIILYTILLTITAYKPKNIEILSIKNNKRQIVKTNSPISFLTFDIKHCSIGKNETYYTGNRNSTASNLKGIADFLSLQKTDFILLQGIDKKAARTSYIDEQEYLAEALEGYISTYAYNYKSLWIPLPLKKPVGYIESGMSTFSEYMINVASRYKYTAQGKWPVYLTEAEPCFIETRIPVDNGKELIIVNSQLSEKDNNDNVRKQELDYLEKYIENEYKKGNYVIVGGNWEYSLPGTDPSSFRTVESWPDWLERMPDAFKPNGFTWAADNKIPSVRTDENPYKKNINFTAVTDGFLVSDNIEILSVNNSDLGFQYSDHNPAKGVFIMKR